MGDRVVMENKHFVVLSPFAARFPFEVAIYPQRHSHDFTLMEEGERQSLAETLRETLQRMSVILQDPPYNYILHTSPNTAPGPGQVRTNSWLTLEFDFHWHLEIVPRLTRIAGFEWGTGFYINPVSPEDSTRYFREAELE